MTASPFADIFDVLQQPMISADLLEIYRVAWFGGDVIFDATDLTTLQTYCVNGGVVVVQAAQLLQLGTQIESIAGAALGPVVSAELTTAIDTQTGWNMTMPPGPSLKRICVVGSAQSSWYIKTGGDPARTSGWDGGTFDKCCRSGPASCHWVGSKTSCEAALVAGAQCLGCTAGETNLGCPVWNASASTVEVQSVASLSNTTDVLVTAGPSDAGGRQVPVVIRHAVGKGAVITFLLEDAAALRGLGVQSHVMQRLADDLTPFILLDDIGADARPRVSVSLARTAVGWSVTLVNNLGVTKQPSTAAVTDPTAAVRVTLACKAEYGTLSTARLLSAPARVLEPVNGKVQVTIPAGDVVVIAVGLAPP
jgi:hypothetical protein